MGLSDNECVSVQFQSSRRYNLEDFVQPLIVFHCESSIDQGVIHVRVHTVNTMKKCVHFHEYRWCGRDSEWEATIAVATHRRDECRQFLTGLVTCDAASRDENTVAPANCIALVTCTVLSVDWRACQYKSSHTTSNPAVVSIEPGGHSRKRQHNQVVIRPTLRSSPRCTFATVDVARRRSEGENSTKEYCRSQKEVVSTPAAETPQSFVVQTPYGGVYCLPPEPTSLASDKCVKRVHHLIPPIVEPCVTTSTPPEFPSILSPVSHQSDSRVIKPDQKMLE